MNPPHKTITSWAVIILAITFLLSACQADSASSGAISGTLVADGSHSYGDGVNLPGVLVILDGQVNLEEGSRLLGSVFQLGGVLTINGTIEGDVSTIGGQVALGETAQVNGDLRVGGGELIRSDKALVRGRVLTGAASGLEPGDIFPQLDWRSELLRSLPGSFLLAVLAYLAIRYAPSQVERVMQAGIKHPAVSTAMGLLGGVVGLVLLVVMAFTLILLPVTLLGLVLGFLSIGYGLIGIGLAAGRFLDSKFSWKRSSPASAFIGTLAFSLLLNGIALLPYIGDLIVLIALSTALGAVLLTRFGLREFVPESLTSGESDELFIFPGSE
jgi:hypothetical protein